MSARDGKPETEETNAGAQTLMRGVVPITQHDRLLALAAAPMAPPRRTKKL